MSFGSSLDAKEQIKQAVDIVDLVGRYIQLRRQGRNYVGLCPWHDDSRPSLQVNPERQSFKCWVCDIGGDVFSFVMKMEGVEFREALAILADRAGIALAPPQRPGGQSGGNPAGVAFGEGKRALYRAMAWAEEQYHQFLLNASEADSARRYLAERKITAESITKFHLGLSPNKADWILSRAGGSDARAKVLETIGLLARTQDGRLYDRFRGRVLFSIRDSQDRPVGTGGRVLPEFAETTRAKYLNSPETPLFAKSSLLYGLDQARHAMRKSRRALVMEGYTDTIVAHQHGFADAVAVLGTALGERHIQILKRFVDEIVLVLDGDEAGQKRTNEVLELFIAADVDLKIVTLPEELDPAEFLEEHGAEAFQDLLATRAVDALEHAFRATTRGIDLVNDTHRASQALERLVSIVAKAPRLGPNSGQGGRLREEKILQRLAFQFRVPEQEVRRRLTELRRLGRERPAAPRPASGQDGQAAATPALDPIDACERELLELLLRNPGILAQMRPAVPVEEVASAVCRRIYQTCCQLADEGGEPTFGRLMLAFDEPAVKSLLVELDERAHAKGTADPQAVLKELIRSFQRRQATRSLPAVTGALRQGGLNSDEELELLRSIEQQAKARHGIS